MGNNVKYEEGVWVNEYWENNEGGFVDRSFLIQKNRKCIVLEKMHKHRYEQEYNKGFIYIVYGNEDIVKYINRAAVHHSNFLTREGYGMHFFQTIEEALALMHDVKELIEKEVL